MRVGTVFTIHLTNKFYNDLQFLERLPRSKNKSILDCRGVTVCAENLFFQKFEGLKNGTFVGRYSSHIETDFQVFWALKFRKYFQSTKRFTNCPNIWPSKNLVWKIQFLSHTVSPWHSRNHERSIKIVLNSKKELDCSRNSSL